MIIKAMLYLDYVCSRIFTGSGKYLTDEYVDYVLNQRVGSKGIHEMAIMSIKNNESIESAVDAWLEKGITKWYGYNSMPGVPLSIIYKIKDKIRPALIVRVSEIRNQVALDYMNGIDAPDCDCHKNKKSSGGSSSVPVVAPIIMGGV